MMAVLMHLDASVLGAIATLVLSFGLSLAHLVRLAVGSRSRTC